MSTRNRKIRKIRRAFRKLLKLGILEFYTKPRIMKILGPDGLSAKEFDWIADSKVGQR